MFKSVNKSESMSSVGLSACYNSESSEKQINLKTLGQKCLR